MNQALEQQRANHGALTPLVFLDWSADVYPQRTAVIHGARRYTWAQTRERCRRLASALTGRGIGTGETVAVLLHNTPEMIEAHFGVPMTGAVLCTINTRLDAETVAYILGHSEAKVLLVDRALAGVAAAALEQLDGDAPLVVDVDDSEYTGEGDRIGELDYEALLESGDPDFVRSEPTDEWQAIALNYTSGTTGRPKGVVYHHRGAHLNAVNNIVTWGMPQHSVYLWTLPLFHCNGWCFAWTMAANAGTQVCLRQVEAGRIFTLMAEHRVTHYCGAPVVHSMLIEHPEDERPELEQQVHGLIAAAPPPASVIEGMETLGIDLTHVYGLTETYGPATVCAKQSEWADLDVGERAARNGRQGVRSLLQDAMTVIDTETGAQVPHDGETMGEIVYRGNVVMKGYLKDPENTAEAFADGWYHTGDLAVIQPDGYLKIQDRAKDVIISGGENISSVEVEDVLYRHPAVAAAAVVAKPHPKWGETPLAMVELKSGNESGQELADELIAHCREHLAKYKCPREVVFTELPKTSTGKIQKAQLREQAKSADSFA